MRTPRTIRSQFALIEAASGVDHQFSLGYALEGVQYEVGDMIRRAGGLNANYLGVELRFGW